MEDTPPAGAVHPDDFASLVFLEKEHVINSFGFQQPVDAPSDSSKLLYYSMYYSTYGYLDSLTGIGKCKCMF